MKVFQKGFNYSQDGIGNRLVFHLQGCNMKCPWCSNPEGIKADGVLIEDREWLLESICPRKAIVEGKLNREVCKDCQEKKCITEHRTKGIRQSYIEMSVDEIVAQVLENNMMFYDGGGVTFTGGEATLQFQELMEVLKRLKESGIHTALETNGTHVHLEESFPYIDQLILDCKLCDDEKHRRFTGISNKQILANIRKAARSHSFVHVRVPVIGGVNDSEADVSDFLRFFETIRGNNITFEILSYHEFGRKKWEQCGWEYEMTDAAYVQAEIVKQFQENMVQRGLNYIRT